MSDCNRKYLLGRLEKSMRMGCFSAARFYQECLDELNAKEALECDNAEAHKRGKFGTCPLEGAYWFFGEAGEFGQGRTLCLNSDYKLNTIKMDNTMNFTFVHISNNDREAIRGLLGFCEAYRYLNEELKRDLRDNEFGAIGVLGGYVRFLVDVEECVEYKTTKTVSYKIKPSW